MSHRDLNDLHDYLDAAASSIDEALSEVRFGVSDRLDLLDEWEELDTEPAIVRELLDVVGDRSAFEIEEALNEYSEVAGARDQLQGKLEEMQLRAFRSETMLRSVAYDIQEFLGDFETLNDSEEPVLDPETFEKTGFGLKSGTLNISEAVRQSEEAGNE